MVRGAGQALIPYKGQSISAHCLPLPSRQPAGMQGQHKQPVKQHNLQEKKKEPNQVLALLVVEEFKDVLQCSQNFRKHQAVKILFKAGCLGQSHDLGEFDS